MSRSIFVSSDKLGRYKAYDGYPWLFQRSDAVLALCRRHGLMDRPGVELREPVPATVEQLERFHTREYLEAFEKANGGTAEEWMLAIGLGTTECPVYPGCFDYHKLVAGSTLTAAAALDEPDVRAAFVPTGGMHHAGPDFASGFCYLNDAVLAIHHFLDRGLRVLYLDIDAHHGDLVQEAFYQDDRVLKISFHETPETLFPFKTGFVHEMGDGPGRGYNVNVPLAPGTSDEAFTWAFHRIVPPLANAFGPQVLVTALGADGLSADPMTNLMLTTAGYCDAVSWMANLGIKVLGLGCGGYLLDSVTRALTLAWALLSGAPLQDEAELLFGGAFRGDGLTSLQDRPVFVPEDRRAAAHASVAAVVETIRANQFVVLGADVA